MRNFCTAAAGSAQWALQEGIGALICTPPDDARGLARAGGLTLLDDPAGGTEMGARGRKYVEGQSARDVVLGRYAKLFEQRVPA